MIVLGLTGSIGMGKSTLAKQMLHLKIPVHEADKVVHSSFEIDSPIYFSITAAFPYFEFPQIYEKKTKRISRKMLGDVIFTKDELRMRLESILHPFIQQSEESFLQECRKKHVKFACLDIPLLFETGADKRVDYTIVVSAPDFVQRYRVLSRPDMTEKKFQDIIFNQMPNNEKCLKADYIIPTGLGLAHSLKCLKLVLIDIEKKEYQTSINENKKLKEKQCDPRNRPRY